MRCAYCNTELKPGCIYCSNCGKEAQIVPDYNELDDYDLNSVLEDESQEENRQNKSQKTDEEKLYTQEAQREKKAQKEKKAQQKKIIIISVIVAVIAIAIIISLVVVKINSNRNNSVDYQIKQAQSAYYDNNIKDAILYYEKALSLDQDNLDVRFALVDIYLDENEDEAAIILLQEIINIDKNNYDAYKDLISIYDKSLDYDSIVALYENVSDDKVKTLFSDYIVPEPELSEKEGKYDEALSIELYSEKGLEVFYTLGDLDPKTEGKLYTSAIDIDQAGETVLNVVAKNSKGVYSNIVTAKYDIEFASPDAPEVTPDGGTFDSVVSISVSVPDNCKAYYTWDSTDPNINSTEYTGPIEVIEGNNVLSVILHNEKTDKWSSIYRGRFEYYSK